MLKTFLLHPRLQVVWLISRFGVAGLINTAIGLSVITALDLGAKVDPQLANAAGYAVGLASGFALNRKFVFRNEGALGRTGIKYLVAVLLGFLLNQAVLSLVGEIYGDKALARFAAQLTAMASYTALVFALCRFWVFGAQSPSLAANASAAGQAASNT